MHEYIFILIIRFDSVVLEEFACLSKFLWVILKVNLVLASNLHFWVKKANNFDSFFPLDCLHHVVGPILQLCLHENESFNLSPAWLRSDGML